MPLPPLPEFLRPKPTERSSGPADESQAIQAARTRARQRLVGALVLLVVGVVTFPLLFETQPRPLAVDTPIKLSQRDSGTVGGVSPAASPSVPAPAPVLPEDAGVEAPPADSSASASVPPEPVEVVMAPRQDPAPRPVVQPPPQAPVEPVSRPQAVPEPKPPVPAPTPPAAAARVTAPAASAAVGRFVVQVGAFSDARTLREARQKVERLGLKTYTQVIDSSAGQRTRVRVGPFESRSEAEAAARTLQGGGLPAAILAL